MHFQWYPGHMTKAKRMMQEDIKLIDLVIELVDARIPMSSLNPDIDELGKNKARLILLNKSDLAEDGQNDAWAAYFKEKGYSVVKVNAKKGGGIKSINGVIQEACKEKIERDRKRGILNRPVRAMVVGIPNVGKSTFINALAGKACTKTGNKPGVTKGKQWIRLNKNVELLDTPGILWPRFEDQTVGLRLAFIGSINDEILNREELAAEMIQFMKKHYQGVLAEFGPDILDSDKQIDSKKLGGIIFNDNLLKEKLNQILHPLIKSIVREEIKNIDDGLVFLDCPLLFETDFHELCDLKVVVYVNMDTQISRLMERDGITFPEALKKIYAQMSLDDKLALADYVLDNCHSLNDLDWQIKQLLFRLERMN